MERTKDNCRTHKHTQIHQGRDGAHNILMFARGVFTEAVIRVGVRVNSVDLMGGRVVQAKIKRGSSPLHLSLAQATHAGNPKAHRGCDLDPRRSPWRPLLGD